MEKTFSNEFKKSFLLLFTKELILHSEKRDILKLKKIIEKEEKKEKIIPVQENIVLSREIESPSNLTVEQVFNKPKIIRQITRQIRQPLFIAEPKLPSHLEYLKPIPTPGVEIDLFKLNPLIRDPAVRIIEANPDERVIVSGTMGTKPTDIILSKEDIDRIINKFSEVSKIPATEGVYKVVIGNLILSAIISETTGSRLIIRKMVINPNPINRQLPSLPFQNNLR